MNKEDLLNLLEQNDVPVDQYGKGEAKTLQHLLNEVKNGECELVVEEERLTRKAHGAMVDVFYQNGSQKLHLKEVKQIFTDGRERSRRIVASIGEKLTPNEKPVDAARRALQEELSITESLDLIEKGIETGEPVVSQSYPGLSTVYTFYHFDVHLPKHLYKPEGYKEVQVDKTTYWEWEVV